MTAIRRIRPGERKLLYLTFDDGPDRLGTPAVLDVLARHEIKATFFVIAEKAKREKALLDRIAKHGHAIGNHSLDHRYRNYFRGRRALQAWITRSESMLQELLGHPTVGFRPPAGICTPDLHAVLDALGMPLLLWNTRFFDTTFAWSENRAIRSLRNATPGDIILLHDRQSPGRQSSFLGTLDRYAREASQAGFAFDVLPRPSPGQG